MRGVLCSLLIGVMVLGADVAAQSRQTIPGPMPNLPFSAAVSADGLIYVAGTLVAEGDVKAQTRATIEQISGVLQKSGSSLANVASVNVYLTKAADFAAMNEVYRTFWPKDPPVRTTVVSELVIPGALVEMSMIAIPNGGERVVIHPSDWIKSPNPYSYGIRSGDTLFLSGLVARNGKDNSVVEGDMTTQTNAVLDNAAQVLKAAGMGFENIVSSRVFITDQARFQDMNKAYVSRFPKEPPARATVIAPLMGPQYQVEIQFVASRQPKRVITTPAADGSPGKPSPILSSAIEVGNRLYLAGMLGTTPETAGDAEKQTLEILNRVGRTMKAAGYDWSHVVDGIVYITDVKHYDGMNRAYRTVFGKSFPARATVRAGLVNKDGLVEIMFVAVK